MSYQIGDNISELSLPCIDGSQFTLDQAQGKRYMLSFMRFSACPFCQLRIHQLISHWQELDKNFTVIAVFDSPLEDLQKHTNNELAPFPILADEHYFYYQEFAVKQSISGMFKAMIFRMPTLLYAMIGKRYFPSSIKGKVTTLPADFLVDENGIIESIYHAKDSGDHIPFDRVKAFASRPIN
ncbi:MAG: redoxin domain-containing protein [Methylococcales bacterium]|nr:redoxin domain-containing protein [Methylococcales bacterium]